MAKILLCDGHNLAFRAFYGIAELSRSDGFPTNMIHGWLRTFWRLEDDENSHWFQIWSPIETRALIEHSALFIGEEGI